MTARSIQGVELRRSLGAECRHTGSLQPDVFVSHISVIARGVFLPWELK